MNNTVNLSKRLKETASFVPPGIRLPISDLTMPIYLHIFAFQT